MFAVIIMAVTNRRGLLDRGEDFIPIMCGGHSPRRLTGKPKGCVCVFLGLLHRDLPCRGDGSYSLTVLFFVLMRAAN